MPVEFFPFVMSRAATHPIELIERLALTQACEDLDRAFALEDELALARAKAVEAVHALVPALVDAKARSRALDLKRRLFKGGAAPALEELDWLGPHLGEQGRDALRALEEKAADHARLLARAKSSFESDLARARAELSTVLSDAFVREAVFLSHQGMYESMVRYVDASRKGPTHGKERKFERHIAAHLARACTKTIPRGLLTAVRLGEIDPSLEETVVFRCEGEGRGVFKRRTFVSLVTMRAIAAELTWKKPLFEHVKPRANPTWRDDPEAPGKLLFWRVGRGEETLCRLPKTDLIEAFLKEAEPRALTARELIVKIHGSFQALELGEIEDFYRRLCEKGLLIGTLEIPFDEIDGLGHLLRWLQSLPASARPAEPLSELLAVQEELRALDAGGEDEPRRMARYERAMELLGRNYQHTQDEPLMAFQAFVVDSLSPWKATLGRPALRELEALWEQLVSIQAERDRGAAVKDNLYRSLSGLCSGRALTALVEVVDQPAARPAQAPEAAKAGGWRASTPSAFQALAGQTPCPAFDGTPAVTLPARQGAPAVPGDGFFTLQFARDAQGGARLVLHQSSPGLMSGFLRWHHLFADTALVSRFKEHVASQPPPRGAQAGAVRASPLYHHGTQTDTASCLPSLYPYEIELTGPPSRYPVERIIPISQLYLANSEAAREIKLVWIRDGASRAVVPCYDGLLGAGVDPGIKALRLLAGFFKSASVIGVNPRWALNAHGESDPPLRAPRVQIGEVTAARRSWVLPVDEPRSAERSDAWRTWTAWRRFRRTHGLPRRVFVRAWTGDETPFYLDFDDFFLIDGLASLIEADPQSRQFEEMLPAPGAFAAKDATGSYAHELVVGLSWR